MPDQTPINSPNPYNISTNQESGLYTFHTDQELEYICGFKSVMDLLPPMVGVYDIEVFDFEFTKFDPHPEKRKKQDSRVSDTINQLLLEFFSDNKRVLIYVCDSTDGRAQVRSKTFRKWFDRVPQEFRRSELEIEIQGFEPVYGCVLTRNDFPHNEILQTEVIDRAPGFMMEKYGQ